MKNIVVNLGVDEVDGVAELAHNERGLGFGEGSSSSNLFEKFSAGQKFRDYVRVKLVLQHLFQMDHVRMSWVQRRTLDSG